MDLALASGTVAALLGITMKTTNISRTTTSSHLARAHEFLPAGTYKGVWGGDEVEIPQFPGVVIHTDIGVRGSGYPVLVTVTSTEITFEQL